jgi:Xaa-Pro dipeptidase
MRDFLEVRHHLDTLEIDYFLVVNPVNVLYLSGLKSTNAILLITPTAMHVCTDPRYEVAAKSLDNVEVHIGRDLIALAYDQLHKTTSLAVDEHFSFAQFKRLQALDQSLIIRSEANVVEHLRLVKTESELRQIEIACTATSEIWSRLLSDPFIGKSEKQIARRIHALALELNADDLAFPSIVAAGVNSASPHHVPTDYVIQKGDFIKCDFGAMIDGFHSDMTRMAIAGAASEWQKEIFEVVTKAQAEGAAQIRAGISSKEIDEVARNVIAEAGFLDYFTHPTGHGIGLEIHEIPIHGSRDITLAQSMTLTVEPGIYLPGKGGVRLEDTLVVLNQGSRNLTQVSKSLAVVE